MEHQHHAEHAERRGHRSVTDICSATVSQVGEVLGGALTVSGVIAAEVVRAGGRGVRGFIGTLFRRRK